MGLHSPGTIPPDSAPRAEEEQDTEVRLGCWEVPSAPESSSELTVAWAELGDPDPDPGHTLGVKAVRTPAGRETGNNRSEHSHSRVEKAGNNCRLLAKLVALVG